MQGDGWGTFILFMLFIIYIWLKEKFKEKPPELHFLGDTIEWK
jgi:hypothetical protein